MEYWYDVKGYEGYYVVSDRKRLKSLDRKVLNSIGQFIKREGRYIKINHGGYSFILHRGDVRKCYTPKAIWNMRGQYRSLSEI